MSLGHLHDPVTEVNGLSLYFSGEVAIIVMNRGENRLNREFIDAFNILLDEVENNTSCKGLITTGKGKFFSNGVDLDWMRNQTYSDLEKFFIDLIGFYSRILFYPLPTIAAMNGHAFAGGAMIALAHDLRTMRDDKGWFSLNEARFGGRFQGFGLAYMRAKIGEGRNLTDVLVLAQRFTAVEAFNRGLVHAVVPESRLILESARILKSFHGKSGYPRESLVNMKQDVYKGALEAAKKYDTIAAANTIKNFERLLGKVFKSPM